jgi:hypothetical protein
MYKEYPINPVTDLWEKLDSISLDLLISQTIEHHRPQEERNRDFAVELNEKFKQEKGESSMVLSPNGKEISANDFMNFKFETE